MRYLSRSKIYEKSAPKKDAKKIYVFCEGAKTEINYFKYFQGISSNIDIIPIANEDGKSDPEKLQEHAKLLFFGNEETVPKYILSSDYKDDVWFVIDTDRWNEGDKINLLRSFCNANASEENGWLVAQSNPCFELWLYYHFHNEKPNQGDVDKCTSFKLFVNEKINGGFDSRSMPIEFQNAIVNSENNFVVFDNQPAIFSTEMHFLAKSVLPFIKDQIDKLILMTKKMNENGQFLIPYDSK